MDSIEHAEDNLQDITVSKEDSTEYVNLLVETKFKEHVEPMKTTVADLKQTVLD